MPKNNPLYSDYVRNLKVDILDKTLVLIAAFGLIINIPGTFRAFNQGTLGETYVIQISIIVGFVFVALFRKKIKHITKAILVILLMCGILISAFNAFGFLATAKVYIPVISLFIAFVYTTRLAYVGMIIFMLIYTVFAFLHVFGHITIRLM